MGILSFWRGDEQQGDRGLRLLRAVREQMPDADDTDVKIIASITGLLGQVAYVERPYRDIEERQIRRALGEVTGLSAAGADAICGTLRSSIATIADIEAHEYAKLLRALADRDLLLHVLDLLLDVAAADDEVTVPEVNLIRRLATSLGLTQADYNASQGRHKDKLAALARATPSR